MRTIECQYSEEDLQINHPELWEEYQQEEQHAVGDFWDFVHEREECYCQVVLDEYYDPLGGDLIDD